MKKIVTIVGARPQFVKAAVVSRALQRADGIQEVLVHTGQHYDYEVSGIFFKELSIAAPAYHLEVGSASHGKQTGKMLERIEELLIAERPDWVMVYGDTNSTLAGALAASKLHIPVAHVEAGLRSFNRAMPEETNRVLTDHVSELLFAPTEAALDNLKREGIATRIVRCGDVMYDAALYYGEQASRQSHILEALKRKPNDYILATIHRAENTDSAERLNAIISGLSEVSEATPVVLPMHPRTSAMLGRHGLSNANSGKFQMIGPVGFLDMIELEKNARLIVTDSGGVQKEATFHNVMCVTLRDETEWIELVEMKRNRLVSPELGTASVARAILEALNSPPLESVNIYGDGHAAEEICSALQA